jgi:hypothetical protein
MAKKKKGPAQKDPEPPKAEAPGKEPTMTQQLIETPPQNGAAQPVESPEFIAGIKAKAADIARECGLREPFLLTGPDRVNYPVRGHGYVVVVKEQSGKQRMGSARFNAEGEHRYWSLDGIVTG